MKEKLQKIRENAIAQIENSDGLAKLNDVRVAVLGKKGELTAVLKSMKEVAPEDRPKVGQWVNETRQEIENKLDEMKKKLEAAELEHRLENEVIDVTLPAKKNRVGHSHPNTMVLEEVERIFTGMGYEVVEGPEVIKSRFLGDKFISKGSLSSSVVDISSVMRTALEKNASKIVLLHNHPSGDCTPSKDDIAVTDRLAEGSRIFSIELCDHIIIGDNEYYSFYENKII